MEYVVLLVNAPEDIPLLDVPVQPVGVTEHEFTLLEDQLIIDELLYETVTGPWSELSALISTVGPALLIITVTVEVVVFPAASRATAYKVWEPLPERVELKVVLYGTEVSSAPRLPPSSLNWTPTTPTLSEALAVMETDEPETVAPSVGEVMETDGAVVSTGVIVLIISLPFCLIYSLCSGKFSLKPDD